MGAKQGQGSPTCYWLSSYFVTELLPLLCAWLRCVFHS